MRNPTTFLRLCFAGIFITAAIAVGIFESGMLATGIIADEGSRYVFNIIGVSLTLLLLPLGLKLLTFSLPKRQSAASVAGYLQWAVLRLDMLAIPLYFNLVGYYLLGHYATCGWLAMMAAVMFAFVWPSDGRMRYERATAYPQDEHQSA